MSPKAASALLHGAGAIAGAAWVWLSWLSRREPVGLTPMFTVVGIVWLALGVGFWGARSARPRHVLAAVWVWGLLFRAAGFVGEPLLEDDWARYLWDGRQFALTGNPYHSPPGAHFADAVPERFARLLDEINHPNLPTIYGPVCQFAFLLSYWIAPGELWPLKLVLLAADFLTLALLLRLAAPRHALLYAWCPLLIQETAFTAHLELLWIAPVVVALHGFHRKKWTQVAVGCGFAIGSKVFAILIAPFLLWHAGRRHWALCALVIASCHAWFWTQGSWADLAGLSLMATHWEFNSTLFRLTRWVAEPWVARLLTWALFASAWVFLFLKWIKRPDHQWPPGALIFGLFFALCPVVNPWYLLALLPFLVLRPSAWGFAALVVVTLSYTHGLHVQGEPSLAPYELPGWVPAVELGVVLLAVAASRFAAIRQRRLFPLAERDRD